MASELREKLLKVIHKRGTDSAPAIAHPPACVTSLKKSGRKKSAKCSTGKRGEVVTSVGD